MRSSLLVTGVNAETEEAPGIGVESLKVCLVFLHALCG